MRTGLLAHLAPRKRFLAVVNAGLREVPDLPATSDREWTGFGYEMRDNIEYAVLTCADPRAAATNDG